MTLTSKSDRKAALEVKIEKTHAMKPGPVYQWEACGISSTDTCAICGFSHSYGRNGQNTGSYDRYQDSKGNDLTLAEAARLKCE